VTAALGLRLCDPEVGLSAGRRPPCPREPTAAEVARWSSWPDALQRALPLELVGEYLDLGADPKRQPLDFVAYTAWNLGICGIDGIREQSCKGYALSDARTWIGIAEAAGWAFQEAGRTVGAVFRTVAPLLSFIPGIGQGVAAVLASVGALAAGEAIGDAVLEGLSNAIPGGGVARAAFDSAAAAGAALLDGENIGEAALRASRAAVVAHGGPLAGAAFDGGLVVARGQSLQEAGFAVLKNFARGNTLAERAARYAETAARAAREGRPIQDVLAAELAAELRALPAPMASIEKALEIVHADPGLLETGSDVVALAAAVPEPAARAAQAVTRPDGTVDHAALRAVLGVTAAAEMIRRFGLARSRELSAAEVLRAQQEERERARLTSSATLQRSRMATIDVVRRPTVTSSATLQRAKVATIDVMQRPASTTTANRIDDPDGWTTPEKANRLRLVLAAAGVVAVLGAVYLLADGGTEA